MIFNPSISDSPILQITIYEIKHYTLITELLTFTYTFHFFAGLFGGTLLYHRSPLSWYYLGERRSLKKYLREWCSPSTTPLMTNTFNSNVVHILDVERVKTKVQ